MPLHNREELERSDRAVLAATRASLMSDSKWRKVFAVLNTPSLDLHHCVWKIVGRADPVPGHIRVGLHPPRPWIDTFDFGPTPIRDIEWILIPRLVETGRIRQDVETAAARLTPLGKIPMELTDIGLKIIGHLPRP